MTSSTEIPANALARFVRRATGVPAVAWHDRSRAHGVAVVARVRLEDAREVVVKRSGTGDKHRREVLAYRRIEADGVPGTPRLLAHDDSIPALLLDALPGEVDLPPSAREAPAVHEQAGRWLARFQRAAPMADDPLPLDVTYRRRGDRWLTAARDAVDASELRHVRSLLDDGIRSLSGRARLPCHRDYTPRNWLVDGGRLRGVIDFEHARDDVAEVDLVRLASHLWPRHPELRSAFLRGYRQESGPADPDAPWLPPLIALEAVGTIVWARRHGDAAFERAGRDALRRCLAGARPDGPG